MKLIGRWVFVQLMDGRGFIGHCMDDTNGRMRLAKAHAPVGMEKGKKNPMLGDLGIHLSSVRTGPFQTTEEIILMHRAISSITILRSDSHCLKYINRGMGMEPPKIEKPDLRIVQ